MTSVLMAQTEPVKQLPLTGDQVPLELAHMTLFRFAIGGGCCWRGLTNYEAMQAEGAHSCALVNTVYASGIGRHIGDIGMPMELLAELAQAPLPCLYENLDDIEKIMILKAHGISRPRFRLGVFGSVPKPTTVHAVTAHGRRALSAAWTCSRLCLRPSSRR